MEGDGVKSFMPSFCINVLFFFFHLKPLNLDAPVYCDRLGGKHSK